MGWASAMVYLQTQSLRTALSRGLPIWFAGAILFALLLPASVEPKKDGWRRTWVEVGALFSPLIAFFAFPFLSPFHELLPALSSGGDAVDGFLLVLAPVSGAIHPRFARLGTRVGVIVFAAGLDLLALSPEPARPAPPRHALMLVEMANDTTEGARRRCLREASHAGALIVTGETFLDVSTPIDIAFELGPMRGGTNFYVGAWIRSLQTNAVVWFGQEAPRLALYGKGHPVPFVEGELPLVWRGAKLEDVLLCADGLFPVAKAGQGCSRGFAVFSGSALGLAPRSMMVILAALRRRAFELGVPILAAISGGGAFWITPRSIEPIACRPGARSCTGIGLCTADDEGKHPTNDLFLDQTSASP